MLSMEKRRLTGDMIALFKYLKGCHIQEGQDLFSILPECRTRNNGLKLQEARFHLDIRKNFLTVRAVRQWIQLPREVVALLPHWRPSRGSWTSICQGCFELDSCIEQGVGPDGLVGPFQLYYSLIL